MHYGYGDFTIQSDGPHLSHCLASLDGAVGDAAACKTDSHIPSLKAKGLMRD